MAEYAKPLPEPNVDTKEFWEAAREHVLKLQQCAACGAFRYYPRPICPECMSLEFRWERVSGRGRVYTYTVIHRAPHPGFREDVPFVMAVVKLEEGPRMLTNIVGCPPEAVQIDQAVEVVFEDASAEISLPKFRPSA
jgi:uncharacterized OB-fold protein